MKIYRFIPSFIRKEIAAAEIEWQQKDQKRSRENYYKSLPYQELAGIHIQNLKSLLNREDLLEHMPKNCIVAEIGVDRGVFAQKIILSTNPKRLHLIDFWGGEHYHGGLEKIVAHKFRDLIKEKKVEINRGISIEVLSGFEDKYFDWVYIDTDHCYETMAAELKICARKVTNNGIIAGHDYLPGSWVDDDSYGVIIAVNEFCFKENWEIIYLTCETHRHLSFAIKKMDPVVTE